MRSGGAHEVESSLPAEPTTTSCRIFKLATAKRLASENGLQRLKASDYNRFDILRLPV